MKTLLLIDANGLVHRTFHALPAFTNSSNKPTGALYGLASILIKILPRPDSGEQKSVDFIAALFDRPEPTFRKELFKEYKIQRPKAPEALISQIKEAHTLFKCFNIKTFEIPGFEADDLIGSLVKKFKNIPDLKIKVLTGDLDTLQLVDNEKIVVEFLKTGVSETKIYDEKAVIERYGVFPAQLPDFKGLVGDASDNIPGVKGIGPKTASFLISKFETLENLFKAIETNPALIKDKTLKKIFDNKEQALLSRDLAKIHCEAPVEVKDIEELAFKGFSKEELKKYFQDLGFKSLIKRLEAL